MQECFEGLDDYLMVFVLLQTADHNDSNDALDALDSDWDTSAVDC